MSGAWPSSGVPAVPPSVHRFRQAIGAARELPPNLLSQGQKLKLYALYQQTQGVAPEPMPETAVSELDIAKWEAWHDVRGMNKKDAMESYARIIESLVAMLREDEAGAPPTQPPPPPESEDTPAIRAKEEEAAEEDEEYEYDEDEEGEYGEDEYYEEDDDNGDEPKVTQTVWSTAALTVAAGSTLDVPLSVDGPSRCTYTMSIVSGMGPIGFRILPAGGGAPHLNVYSSSADGAIDVHVNGPSVLVATLDNSAAMMSSVDVKCRVCFEPLMELAAHAEHLRKSQLRADIAGKLADLLAQERTTKQVTERALGCESQLAKLHQQVAAAESELQALMGTLQSAEGRRAELKRELAAMRAQLRQ